MRRFRRRCAGSVDVEETYSRLLVDGRGSSLAESLMAMSSDKTAGKCWLRSDIALSTRPHRISVRISANVEISTGHLDGTLLEAKQSVRVAIDRWLTLTKLYLLHMRLESLLRVPADTLSSTNRDVLDDTWSYMLNDDLVSICVKMPDSAFSIESSCSVGVTAMTKVVKH